MMIIPPIWLNSDIIWFAFSWKIEFIATPNAENTTENPSTKNIELKNTFALLIDMTLSFVLISDSVVPEIYARNAGTMGKIHGAKNEPIPAKNAITIEISAIGTLCSDFINSLTQWVFILAFSVFYMNSRFYVIIAGLGSIIAFAFIMGSPALGGFDMMR